MGGGWEWEDKVGGEKRGKCEETGEFKGAEVSEKLIDFFPFSGDIRD